MISGVGGCDGRKGPNCGGSVFNLLQPDLKLQMFPGSEPTIQLAMPTVLMLHGPLRADATR